MSSESPLYVTRIECPVCKNGNEFEAIKVGSYQETGRETDFRPTGRQWRNPEFQHINPLTYAMATCASCYYTRELDGDYKHWQRDTSFKMYKQKTLREAHLRQLADPGGLLRTLGTHLAARPHPHETAVNKLLLAIQDELILDEPDRLNVARYYLRIAWLYREQGNGHPDVDPHELGRSQLRRRLESHAAAWEQWCATAFDLAQRLAHCPDGTTDYRARIDALNQQVVGMLAEWRAHSEAPAGRPQTDVSAPSAAGQAYFDFASHQDFLAGLRTVWNDVPRSEAEALCAALERYVDYYQNCRAFPRPELEVQTTYLIGELARRTGQSKLAQDYFNHSIRKGHELIHQFQKDVQRTNYVRKLVEMSIEQGKKNRVDDAVSA